MHEGECKEQVFSVLSFTVHLLQEPAAFLLIQFPSYAAPCVVQLLCPVFYFILENSFGIMTSCMCALKIALGETKEVLWAF